MASPKELIEELKLVFSGRNSILDSLIPVVLYIIVNAVYGITMAPWVALGCSLVIVILRLVRRQPLWYALGGIGAVLLAIGSALFLKRAEAYFLPALVNGALTTVILTASIIVKRPAVAFTSSAVRRWPLAWYWHPRVRPAYSEVTAIWAVFSGIKFGIQLYFFNHGQVESLALFNLVSGWPALIILLIGSYVYGLNRLKKLKGPGVEEFKNGSQPPWMGQLRGF